MTETVKNPEVEAAPLKRIKNYIASTKIDRTLRIRYDMCTRDADEIYFAGHDDPYKLIVLAFSFGMAKGYRAAKAEAKRGVPTNGKH